MYGLSVLQLKLSMPCLLQDGKNLVEGFETGKGSVAEAFLAGILSHIPALQAFTVPAPISYERLRPGCWSGAFQ
jgi:glutamine synthetase